MYFPYFLAHSESIKIYSVIKSACLSALVTIFSKLCRHLILVLVVGVTAIIPAKVYATSDYDRGYGHVGQSNIYCNNIVQ